MDAIVLKATPYEEDGKILKLFTKEMGLVSAIVKKLTRKGTFWQNLTSPLTRCEFHLTRRSSELYTLSDGSIIDGHYEIRGNLNKLDAACTLLKALASSQYPEKPSPELYKLTTVYLNKIKKDPNPSILALSFQMKLLNHEGLFPETAKDFGAPLTITEWQTLECLCHAKKFETLDLLTIEQDLHDKATDLFNKRIQDFT